MESRTERRETKHAWKRELEQFCGKEATLDIAVDDALFLRSLSLSLLSSLLKGLITMLSAVFSTVLSVFDCS